MVSGNEKAAWCPENKMVLDILSNLGILSCLPFFAVSENERVAYFNQKYSRFWKFNQISAFYHSKVADS